MSNEVSSNAEMSSVATEEMSSVATEEMSSVATEEMSSVATEGCLLLCVFSTMNFLYICIYGERWNPGTPHNPPLIF